MLSKPLEHMHNIWVKSMNQLRLKMATTLAYRCLQDAFNPYSSFHTCDSTLTLLNPTFSHTYWLNPGSTHLSRSPYRINSILTHISRQYLSKIGVWLVNRAQPWIRSVHLCTKFRARNSCEAHTKLIRCYPQAIMHIISMRNKCIIITGKGRNVFKT